MKSSFRLLCIRRKKNLAKKNNRRRRFKRVPTKQKSILCPSPTQIYIPLDLQISTLLRLPVKSLLRFRCVSKLWSSIITSRDFKNRHLSITSSSGPPRLLIAFEDYKEEKILVVSLPNPNASYSSSSSCCVPYKDLNILNIKGHNVYNVSRGLICVGRGIGNVGICNPSTRQAHIFPQIKFRDNPSLYPRGKYFFVYDPVEDQYKMLAIDSVRGRSDHRILVLGREEAWREAPCVVCPHIPRTLGLYMNETMYYGASRTDMDSPHDSIIVSFDIRLETYKIIKVPSKFRPKGYKIFWSAYYGGCIDKTLINYKGKIGVVENPRKGSFRMWVMEDFENEEWSTNTYHLPARFDFKVMNTFYNGEICLVRNELSDPFCLFYYNLDKKSMRSVAIEGLPVSELKRVNRLSVTVLNHYESLTFLET